VFDSGASPVGALRIAVPVHVQPACGLAALHLAAFPVRLPARVFSTSSWPIISPISHSTESMSPYASACPNRDGQPQSSGKLADNPRYVVCKPRVSRTKRDASDATRNSVRMSACAWAYGGSYRTRQVWTFRREAIEGARRSARPSALEQPRHAVRSSDGGGAEIALLPEWPCRCRHSCGDALMRLFEHAERDPLTTGTQSSMRRICRNRRHSSKVRALVQFSRIAGSDVAGKADRRGPEGHFIALLRHAALTKPRPDSNRNHVRLLGFVDPLHRAGWPVANVAILVAQ